MEKLIYFTPAFDKRDPDPRKNYGIGSVEMHMVLKGAAGAVHFSLLTAWNLPHVQEELDARQLPEGHTHLVCHPFPSGISYHAPEPQRDWQDKPTSESCEWLDGRPCYSDGSTLNAEGIYRRLVAEGDKGVWKELESYYIRTFGEEP